MAKVSITDALRMGLEQHQAGHFAAAEAVYRKVLVHDPNNADAMHLLGFLLRQTGRVRTGIDLLQRAVHARPHIAQFHNHLGQALRDLGRGEEAVEAFRTAIQLDPNYAEAHNNLGSALHDQRHFPQAIVAFKKAIALAPQLPDAHSNLGNALLDLGRVDEAAGACRQAIRLNPNFVEAHVNFGNILCEQGLVEEGIEQYWQATKLSPQYQIAWDNLLFTMHMSPRYDAAALLEEHRNWFQTCAQGLAQNVAAHGNDRCPDRRLRVGYVSTDFRDHPVGRFLLPLLANHDREKFEVVCFADGEMVDDYTHRLRQHASAWHVTSQKTDGELYDLVRSERIDVLVDLRVHSSPNRLMVFARKPAPVQVSYLAYPGTTGLPTVDYRLTDAFLDPEGSEAFYTEQSLRLGGTYWCYEAHPQTPEVGALPAMRRGMITFGCLNSFAKVSGPALELWSEVLKAVPRSALLLYAPAGAHRERVKNLFSQRGVDGNRIDFMARQPLADYLRAYERVDIALDPLPFNGGTTTCDALWMGVPVVTLVGQTAVGREGASILNHAGLAEFVAATPEQYVGIAKRWAEDVEGLAGLRALMRERLRKSALLDQKSYAREIEGAYRTAWRRWCAKA
ncbi:MAG TPA: tetratricopeptide repeat protein [Tepidisphaeraceae bacterium]|jgi:predicted O-linked N-acetylglucosamine transferase (SPINDLY family)